MNKATLAVLAYYSIGLSRPKISLKRFLNFNGRASRQRYKKQDRQETQRYKTTGFPGKYFYKRVHELVNLFMGSH